MTSKEHTKAEHAASELYHLHKSKHHERLAEAHGRLAKCLTKADDSDQADCHRELSNIHKAMSSMENERADHHRHMSDLVDAMEMDQPYHRVAGGDLNKLVPTDVRGVIPNAPTAFEQIYGTEGLTAIPRAGQPPIPIRPTDVPLEFQKILGSLSGEDEERPL